MCFLNLYQNPLALWIGRNVWHSLGLSSSTIYTWGTEAERVGDPIFQIWETWTWYLLVLILFTSVPMKLYCIYFFKKDFTYLFLERGEWREKEGAKNINVWLPSHAPYWGPGPQPRHVPWWGFKLVTLWFAGWHLIHWATPARATLHCIYWMHYCSFCNHNPSFQVRITFAEISPRLMKIFNNSLSLPKRHMYCLKN